VGNRIVLLGLGVGAFIVTLAFSSWHEGLWRFERASVTHAAPIPSAAPMTSRTAETALAPTAISLRAAAAVSPPPAVTSPEPVQSEPQSEPRGEPDSASEVDDRAIIERGERGAARGARSR
jgi:hypothetical protein